MPRDWRTLRRPWVLVVFLVVGVVHQVYAKADVAQMSVVEIEEALQQCPLVKDLNRHRLAFKPKSSGLASNIFSFLFPGTPAVNALLATLYISGPPNFLLALCPPNIDPSSLSVMVAFAVGGLLGDTFFHLLPEIFLGEASSEHARFVLADPGKNLILGVAIMVGFVTFVAMDKSLRIATGGSEHSHNHSQESGSDTLKDEKAYVTSGVSSGASTTAVNGEVRSRKPTTDPVPDNAEIPLVSQDLLDKILSLEEPDRSTRWLLAVVEEDPESDITQIILWRAYEAQLKTPRTSLLPAAEFIKKISRIFRSAEAQTVSIRTPHGSESKYIVKGIRPRSSPMNLAEYEASINPVPSPKLEKSTTQSSPSLPKALTPVEPPSQSIRLSAYLNLIADFTHNITDGLALSSSFYASPTLGATTTVAVFFHEIPHEVGDFALLIQSGFSKRRAMAAQFVTALGALLGTCLGIAVQELGRSSAPSDEQDAVAPNKGLGGTGLGWGDLLLPFTAGTFLYVGTVAVIPELLETGSDQRVEIRKAITQFAALAVGAGIMLAISWA